MPDLFPKDDEINLEENNNIENNLNEPLNFEGSYLFDFEKGEFVKNADGTIAKCDFLQAYIQWCHKALKTPRYTKLAYSDVYGSEFDELIGSAISKEAKELEIARITKETLMVHPMTKDVRNFVFNWSKNQDSIYYEYEIITVDYKSLKLDNSVKVG